MPLPPQMEANKSVFNPADLAAMKQGGEFSPDMTVVQALEKMGIDPNGPITQLKQFMQGQVQNANSLNKMKNMAGGPPPAGPAPGGPPPPTPPPGGSAPGGAPPLGGLDSLIK